MTPWFLLWGTSIHVSRARQVLALKRLTVYFIFSLHVVPSKIEHGVTYIRTCRFDDSICNWLT